LEVLVGPLRTGHADDLEVLTQPSVIGEVGERGEDLPRREVPEAPKITMARGGVFCGGVVTPFIRRPPHVVSVDAGGPSTDLALLF